MATEARDTLARLLAGDQSERSDSATFRLPSDALELTVTGVGPITFPVRAAQARRLVAVARPAQFGRGDQTLTDTTVRDTWELTPAQVALGGAQWEEHLDTALAHLCHELGLPPGSELRAELHSMLVYGKGQFFLPHQDSEKHDGMVATLVVALPSVHTGGELVVDDSGTERTYRGSRDDLVLVAFYADRRHEVRPVRSGYRVTLTFNLLLTGSTPTYDGPVEQAAHLLTEHFATRVHRRDGDRDLDGPLRLALLLDHEYSQAGLTSPRFKGSDAERVAVLRAAAEQAGCETVFALADIRETWDALPTQEPWDYGFDDEDADPEDDTVDGGDYDLDELIDDEIRLGWWISPDGSGAESINLHLGHGEVCAVTPSRMFTPYESQYEGYMGNYGNTVDRWYRRAAVVLWPKARSFAARAEAGSGWALRTLRERIQAGELETARGEALSLEPFWRDVDEQALAHALEVAAGLRDPIAAAVVVAPFRLEMLTAEHAPLLAALGLAYGDPWVRDLLETWDSDRHFTRTPRSAWIGDSLHPLCQALRDCDAAPLADLASDHAWRWLAGQIDASLLHVHPGRRRDDLADLAVPLARVFESASEAQRASITTAMRAADDPIVELLVPALRAHRSPATESLTTVVEDCRDRLTRLLDRPPRSSDDWSIDWTGCGCRECAHLDTFLRSRSERTLEWPLAKAGRQHVHRQIDNAGLPVGHTTRRQGRPYTLVLSKTDALFQQEQEARRAAQRNLDWLTSTSWQPA